LDLWVKSLSCYKGGGFFSGRKPAFRGRKLMETKLYVGNLSFSTTEDELRNLFAQAGTVSTVDLIMDRETGKSKGFAFVQMGTQQDAEKAITMFNGYSLGNRELRVNVARPKGENRFGGRGGGGGGGYGNRGGQGGYGNRNRNGGSNRY
jgi:cold-inducible RNA-binding protein